MYNTLMIQAIAFDIDGTLYSQADFTIRSFGFFVAHARTMLAFRSVRKELHAISASKNPEQSILSSISKTHTNINTSMSTSSTNIEGKENFFELQAALLGKKIAKSQSETKQWIETHIYQGWKKIFKKISPYENAVQSIQLLKQAGYKIGLLSDFPPEQKGDIWGLAPLCDAIVGSEYCNALKPSPIPFLELSKRLQVPCEHVLYVGNSYKYDVLGAKAVGMKTALICKKSKKSLFTHKADIVFSHYKELIPLIEQLHKPTRSFYS